MKWSGRSPSCPFVAAVDVVRHSGEAVRHPTHATPPIGADPLWVQRFQRRGDGEGRCLADGAGTATVVLVHGAFEDASYWWLVVQALKACGVSVVVRSIPLRGLFADAEYLAGTLTAVEGPILLVGHNYGGAVISVAAAATDQAVGLVFVAAFIPDVGDTVAEILARSYAADAVATRRTRPYVCRPHSTYSTPAGLTDDRAVSQPIPAAILGEPAWAAAWHELPSWAIVATEDPAIAVELQRAMARQAGARVLELDGAHAIAVTHPNPVCSMIVRALGATATERLVGASRAAAD